ncbi:hypothetical protein C9374_009078 [Naegleria lovaniensis]|uniref:Uncharacterized protein n=1 Tax=Naegleria lovaniensis TaxID=51637 RepID=A0AA88KEJ6_NAELO|nr:uncharacterized protein C9374_009078 [Naegleria lovaniensis]KAG2377562.1 hypothetical protein C9374_009078 [Naegleria lovaniensis]
MKNHPAKASSSQTNHNNKATLFELTNRQRVTKATLEEKKNNLFRIIPDDGSNFDAGAEYATKSGSSFHLQSFALNQVLLANVENEKKEKEKALSEVKEAIQVEKVEHVSLIKEMKDFMATMKKEHQIEIQTLKEEMATMKKEHQMEIEALRKEHQSEIQALKQEMAKLKESMDNILVANTLSMAFSKIGGKVLAVLGIEKPQSSEMKWWEIALDKYFQSDAVMELEISKSDLKVIWENFREKRSRRAHSTSTDLQLYDEKEQLLVKWLENQFKQ